MPNTLYKSFLRTRLTWRDAIPFLVVSLLWVAGTYLLTEGGYKQGLISGERPSFAHPGYLLHGLSVVLLAFSVKLFLGKIDKSGRLYGSLFFDNPIAMVLSDQASGKLYTANAAADVRFFSDAAIDKKSTFIEKVLESQKFLHALALNKAEPSEIIDMGIWAMQSSLPASRFAHIYSTVKIYNNLPCNLFMLVDASDLYQAEEKLVKTQGRLSEVFDSMGDFYVLLDANLKVLELNKPLEVMLDAPRANILGKPFFSVFNSLEPDIEALELRKVFTEKISAHFISLCPLTKMWLQLDAYPASEGVTLFLKDITAQREKEDALAQTRRYLEVIANTTRDSIWYITPDRDIPYYNLRYLEARQMLANIINKQGEAIASILHEIPTELKGKQVNFAQKLGEYYTRGFAGERVEGEVTFPTASGGQDHAEVVITPVFGPENTVIGLACFARDITVRKAHETTIAARNTQLRNITWYQAHEVRGPVARLMGLLHLLEREQDNESTKEMMAYMRTSVLQLDASIRKIVREAA